MGGNLQAYSVYLEATYGAGILQELQKEKQKTIRYFPYEQKIAEYTEKLLNL